MAKLSLKQGAAIAGLLQVVFLIVALGGLAADAEVAERRLDRAAQVQARLLEKQAAAIHELILLRALVGKETPEWRRDKVRRELNLLQSQARSLGIDATFDVRPEHDAGLSMPTPRTVRRSFSIYQAGMVGVVDVRPAEAPGVLAMIGDSQAAQGLLLVNLFIPLIIAGLMAYQHLGSRRKSERVSAGLNELVQKLIDAGSASDDARLRKLLDENAALVSDIRRSAVGLESNTTQLRQTRLGLPRTAGGVRA